MIENPHFARKNAVTAPRKSQRKPEENTNLRKQDKTAKKRHFYQFTAYFMLEIEYPPNGIQLI